MDPPVRFLFGSYALFAAFVLGAAALRPADARADTQADATDATDARADVDVSGTAEEGES